MTPERFKRVHEVFIRVTSTDPDSRISLLNEECGTDADLRQEIERMLRIDSGPPSFASDDAVEVLASRRIAGVLAADMTPRVPERIGPFTIESLIGTGGMGAVYRAMQDSPRRLVALKVLRAGLASRAMVRRFVHEAEFLGRLDHPGIAHIYQAGMWNDGDIARPYFAMELVEGESLTTYAAARHLQTSARLELFQLVCEAVQQAHQRGIIHRDLKPANILVTAEGRPKVLDFGIARATDVDVQVTTCETDTGLLAGTLPYMSPEQLAGDGGDIDARADVYALGIVLFELLSGRRPLDLDGLSMIQAARVVVDTEPPRLGTLNREFRGDLETIIAKALDKDRSRRYQSAGELAADVGRFLRHEPIAASPASTMYQLRKLARRNRAATFAVAGGLVVLLLGIAGTTSGMIWAMRARDASELHRREADDVAAFQASLIADIDPRQVGRLMKEEINTRARTAMNARGMSKEAIEAELASGDRILRDANIVSVGSAVMDRLMLTPALRQIDQQFESQPLVRARLLYTVAAALGTLGQYQRAVKPHADALALRRQHLGSDHPVTLTSIHSLGLSLMRVPDNKGAEAAFREESERRTRVSGPDHFRTLRAVQGTATALRSQGRYAEAEVLFRQVLADQRRTLGPTHEETLVTLRMLGIHLEMVGSYREAEPVLREALDLNRRYRPEDHQETLITAFGLAKTLLKQRKLEESESLFQDVLKRRQRQLGEDHLLTFESHISLCRVRAQRGMHEQVERDYAQIIERAERALPPDTSLLLSARYNRGMSLEKLDRNAEAAAEFRRVLDRRRRVNGPSDSDTLAVMRGLGRVYRAMGRLTELESELTAELESAVQKHGPDHWRAAEVELQCGVMLRGAAKYPDAEARLLRAHTLAAAAKDAPASLDDQCISQLASMYRLWHRAQPELGLKDKAAEWSKRLRRKSKEDPESAGGSEGIS